MAVRIARIILVVVLLAAMVAATSLLHAHAWSQSHQDLGCVGVCEPGQPCHCGWAYSAEFPARFLATAVLLIVGAVCLSLQGSQGRTPGFRWRRAAAQAMVAYLAIAPLNFSLSDWHGESYLFYDMALTLVSLPLSIPVWPALLRLNSGRDFPYLGGDPTFGRFSTRLAADFVALGACAYVQWCVLVPWLRGRVRQWRARRGGADPVENE